MDISFNWLIAFLLLSFQLSPTNKELSPILSTSGAAIQTKELTQERQAIWVATNQQRARHRLAPLKTESRLMQAAQAYADLMAAREQISHTIGGLTLAQKAEAVGYAFRQLSENIALNTRLDGSFVVQEQWMKSKGHQKNLLATTSTDIGIGIAGPSKQNRYYYCQLFGLPR